MKLSISNIGWADKDDEAMYEYVHCLGFKGIEIAPTRIFPESPYENLKGAKAWADALWQDYHLKVSSVQSIWYGRAEKIFGSESEREVLLTYTQKAIDFAEAVSCHNVVFGCPKNRVMNSKADWNIGVNFFRKLAAYAEKHAISIGMEANPAIYGTNYINTTREALALIAEVDMRGFRLNLDLGTMIQNGESPNVLCGNVKYISHVHVSEPFLKPVEKRKLHKQIADILLDENYQGFTSIEMGKVDDLSVLHNVMAYVKEVFGTDD